MTRLALVLVCGCGRIGFDATADTGAIEIDADTSCWPLYHDGTVRFGTPVVIDPLVSTVNETNPYLASDGRHLYFGRGPNTMRDIYSAVRPAPDQPFAPATPLTILNSTADEGRLAVIADGSFGVFASARPGVGGFDLYSVTSLDGGDTFDTPSLMWTGNVNTTAFQGSPELSEDGLRLYYAFVMGANPSIVHVAERPDMASVFGVPSPVAGLDPTRHISDLALSPDERVAVFTIFEAQTDLYYATRESRTGPFGPAIPISELNIADENDDDPTLSADGCELVYSADGATSADLHRAIVLR